MEMDRPDDIDYFGQKNIDLKLEDSSSDSQNVVRSPGFEPGIASLEGLCPKPD
jgi:hypothetical protein